MLRIFVIATAMVALVLVARHRVRDRDPAEPDWEQRASAFERGDGVARDFDAAARVYDDACAHGELAACRRFGFALLTGRGVDVDVDRGLAVFAEACDAGDVPSCAYTFAAPNAAAWRVEIADTACRQGDLDACAAIDEVAGGGCDSEDCASTWTDVERRACAEGSVRHCATVVEREQAAAFHPTTWPPRDPEPWVAYATGRLDRACEGGDVDACAALPDRALPAAELCAAGDRRSC